MAASLPIIRSDAQRQWLDKISQLSPMGESLIPRDRTYKQQLSHYQVQAKLMGVSKLQGLRHAYAQRWYEEITRFFDPNKKGLVCPIDGGKQYKDKSDIEKMLDR